MAAFSKRIATIAFTCAFAFCMSVPLYSCTGQQAGDADAETEALAEEEGDGSDGSASGDDAAATADADDATAAAGADDAKDAEGAQAAETAAATDAASADDATDAASGSDAQERSADPNNCSATIMYYENVGYDDGDVTPDAEGRVLLGTYQLTGLQEGQVLNTWDYVVNIPGFFFWDGWPRDLTVSRNATENVIKLFYFRLWNNQYTVNYYLMENADLTADNWKDALAPDDVDFVKLGSETFTDQRFDKLIKGDAYEYKLDGTYVVDTYPAEIRVGVNPDDNVLNVLYVPDSVNLPSHIEVPSDTTPPDDNDATVPPTGGDDGSAPPSDGDNGTTTPPSDGDNGTTTPPADGGNGAVTPPDDGNGDTGTKPPASDDGATKPPADDNGTATPPSGGDSEDKPADKPSDTPADKPSDKPSDKPGDDAAKPDLPDDTVFDKDDLEAVLPDKDEVIKDFLESGDANDKVEITDEMIKNPVSPSEIDYVKNVYETGLRQGESLAKTGDSTAIVATVCVALGAAAIGIIALVAYRRSKRNGSK